MRVAFQGEPGAYSEQAVFAYFGKVETQPCESFDAVFDSVVSGGCEFGLIPIANSLAGSIHQNYDLLLRNDLHIVGEYPLRVQHCLIALCAPRPVLLPNAEEDLWANPSGQFDLLKAAAPVYRLYRDDAIAMDAKPEMNKLIDSRLGYFIRPGKHAMTRADWEVFLAYADKQLTE